MGMGCHFLLQGIFLTQGSNPVSFISFFAGRFFNAESLGKPHVLETQIYNKFTNFEDLKSSLALHVELDAPLNLSCIYSIHFSFSGLEIILVCLRRINHNTGTKTHFQWQKKRVHHQGRAVCRPSVSVLLTKRMCLPSWWFWDGGWGRNSISDARTPSDTTAKALGDGQK